MKVKTPERGAIAVSRQGRDKGRLYVIVEVTGDCVFLADGVKRKLGNPKAKNVKHLDLLPVNISRHGIEFSGNRSFDNQIAHLLKVLAAER